MHPRPRGVEPLCTPQNGVGPAYWQASFAPWRVPYYSGKSLGKRPKAEGVVEGRSPSQHLLPFPPGEGVRGWGLLQ